MPNIDGASIQSEILDQDDVLHFTGVGFNGLRSVSPLRHALRNAAGIALAADRYSAEFFGAGAKPEIIIKSQAAKLTEEQKEMIRAAWTDIHAGNRRRPGVLGAGMEVQELTINAEEAQLLQARQFQIEDIARIYGVPPFMIGHTQNTTSWGSGVEQMGIGFVKYTLQQHLVGCRAGDQPQAAEWQPVLCRVRHGRAGTWRHQDPQRIVPDRPGPRR